MNIKTTLRAVPSLLKESFNEWSADNAMRLAAALAYYTVFSLSPLLLAAISVGGLVFGQEAAAGKIYTQLQGSLGESVAKSVQELMVAASEPSSGIMGTIIAGALILFGASGVFGELKDSLNIIWKAPPQTGNGIVAWIKNRFLSISMVMGVGFLMLVSLLLNMFLGVVGNFSLTFLPAIPGVFEVVGMVLSFALVTVMFAGMFKFLPDTKVAWQDVWVGAVFTSALFSLGKMGLEIYISRAGVASAYGAAGAMALILVWVYYSAQIFFFGAEFAEVYSRRFGSRQGIVLPTQPNPQLSPVAASKLAPEAAQVPDEPLKVEPVMITPANPGNHSVKEQLGSVAALGAVLALAWFVDKRRSQG